MDSATFDSHCYNLAQQFLSDTDFKSEANIMELVSIIQETMDDFITQLTEEEIDE